MKSSFAILRLFFIITYDLSVKTSFLNDYIQKQELFELKSNINLYNEQYTYI